MYKELAVIKWNTFDYYILIISLQKYTGHQGYFQA